MTLFACRRNHIFAGSWCTIRHLREFSLLWSQNMVLKGYLASLFVFLTLVTYLQQESETLFQRFLLTPAYQLRSRHIMSCQVSDCFHKASRLPISFTTNIFPQKSMIMPKSCDTIPHAILLPESFSGIIKQVLSPNSNNIPCPTHVDAREEIFRAFQSALAIIKKSKSNTESFEAYGRLA